VAIADGLKMSSLLRINLAWNGIGDVGARAVGGALKENSVLQFLDVSSNRIEFEGAKSLAEGIKENQTLRSLQLNANPITDRGVGVIISAVGEQCSVRDLGLQDCSTQKLGESSLLRLSDGIFDPKNPTGRYALRLSDEFDVDVLEELKKLDRMDEASGIDNFINILYEGAPLKFAEGEDIQKWKVPASGLLMFDYVATKRVPKEAKAQRDEVFQSFRKELSNPALTEETKLLMLRSSATTHYWSAEQVRQLVVLVTYRKRVDACVMLFRRIVDLDHFYKEVYKTLKPAERTSLRFRLGESLARLLVIHEPMEPDPAGPPEDETVQVYLTELPEGTTEGGDDGGGDAGGVEQAALA